MHPVASAPWVAPGHRVLIPLLRDAPRISTQVPQQGHWSSYVGENSKATEPRGVGSHTDHGASGYSKGATEAQTLPCGPPALVCVTRPPASVSARTVSTLYPTRTALLCCPTACKISSKQSVFLPACQPTVLPVSPHLGRAPRPLGGSSRHLPVKHPYLLFSAFPPSTRDPGPAVAYPSCALRIRVLVGGIGAPRDLCLAFHIRQHPTRRRCSGSMCSGVKIFQVSCSSRFVKS